MKGIRQSAVFLCRNGVTKGYVKANAASLLTVRGFHATKRNENALLYGGIGILSGAVLFQYGYDFYIKRQEAIAAAPASEEEQSKSVDDNTAKASEEPVGGADDEAESGKKKKEKKDHATAAPSWLELLFLWLT